MEGQLLLKGIWYYIAMQCIVEMPLMHATNEMEMSENYLIYESNHDFILNSWQ